MTGPTPVPRRPSVILLAEDSEGDAELTRLALRRGRLPTELHVVRDGIDALAFLRREDGHAGAPRPDLVLLDLNMPRLGGHGVLEAMQADDDLRSIPVIVLSTSTEVQDIRLSYELHVNCYVRKPIDFSQFLEVMRTIEEFWLETAELPAA